MPFLCMPTTNSLHVAVVLSFAEDKWCVALLKWADLAL